ncbi:MAG: restriction endonuclease, partial [Candidatus Methanofastidiosa archaeon]|nr:restriction endonuclease [Candidatus Methanofastidiosa archaeon]
MKIAQKYSHLNGEEYLIVHHNDLYQEIATVIKSIDAKRFLTKESKEKTMPGAMLYSPIELNKTFNEKFNKLGWSESRYKYFITTDQKILPELITLPYEEQKEFLISKGIKEPISSYKQTDFV